MPSARCPLLFTSPVFLNLFFYVGTKVRRLSFPLSFPCLTFWYTFCPSSHKLGASPTFFYFFQPASLAPFFLFYLSAFSSFQPRSRELAIFPLTYVIRQQIFFLGRLQSFSFSNVVAFEITSPSLSHSPSRPQCTLQS